MQRAHADTTSLSVSPSIIRLDLSQDAPQTQLTYTNTSSQTVELTLSTQNVTELEDGYKLSFLEGKDASNYKYGLSSWIDFDKKTLVIPPHASDNVTVSINTKELTPGGHYGSILAEASSKDGTSGSIGIHATLSSLIFVRTNTGKELEKATLAAFHVVQDGWLLPLPTTSFFRLQNTGDTDLIPYGLVVIRDRASHEVARGIVNTDSASALPESIRRFDVPLRYETALVLPGRYTATISIHAGKTPLRITQQVSFVTQGTLPLIQVVSIAILVGLLWLRKRKSLS